MAEHGEIPTDEPFKPDWMNYMQGFLDGAAEEREACAKLCEEQEDDGGELVIQQQCANAIRARGTK